MEHVKRASEISLRTVVVAVTLFIASTLPGCYISPEGKAKIQELQELAAQTEKPTDFQQADYSHISNSDVTIIAYFYKSAAPYEEVKEFYTRTLSAKGWTTTPDKALSSWGTRDGDQTDIPQRPISNRHRIHWRLGGVSVRS